MEKTLRPLAVDLDGTLLRTDSLHELAVAFLRLRWFNGFILIALLFRDRATLKAELARRTPIDVSLLPLRSDVTELIGTAKFAGRPIVLATASDQDIAHRVATSSGLFEDVIASTPGNNLKGHRKAEALVERYGEKGFDYVGDSSADLVVFARAHTGYLVEPSARLARRAGALGNVEPLGARARTVGPFFRALRPHQWVKNLLVFLPALAAQSLSPSNSLPLVIAFVLFSVMASAVYITNDLLDLSSDRAHSTKKTRPFASGALPISFGLAASPLLGVGALLGAWVLLGPLFTAVLAVYAFLTLAYSMWLKRVVLVDVFTLAGLYGIRVFAGAVAFGISLSPWLAAFSTFAFLSLALLKRVVEITNAREAKTLKIPGRGYRNSDREPLALFGVASGFVAGVVLALYLEDPDTVGTYSEPLVLWAMVPVWLFWISRMWLFAYRDAMKEDPILFAVTDWVSYLAGGLMVTALFLAR